MKDAKLRVRVNGVARDFYLFRPKGQRSWHVIFSPPAEVRERLSVTRICRTTGKPATLEHAPAAREIAARIIADHWSIAAMERAGVLAPKRGELATIGELLEVYVTLAKERPVTVRCNANSLRLLVRTVLGGDPEAKSTSVLTAELIRRFEAARGGNATSTASYMRQARSVVALPKMKFYEGFNLPDLTAFRAERVSGPEPRDLEPLDMNAMRAMEAAAARLAESDPPAYVAHLLFSRLGLRNIEILNARVSWIDGGRIGIIKRPEEDFWPKGRSGWLPIAPDVLREVLQFQALSIETRKPLPESYLVPGANKTERHSAIYRRHSAWVSRWICDRTKTSYELRRYAGSRLLDLGASMVEVRDFLRHKNVATTERWYAYRLQNRNLPVIGMRDLVPEAAVA